MWHVRPLDELQQVNIYTAGLMELLKTDIELQNPNDMKTSMSMARAYQRHANIVADLAMLTSTRATTRMAPQPQLAPRPTPAIAPDHQP